MKGNIHDVEAQRLRWLRYRELQAMSPSTGDDFARKGLGRHVDDLDVRILILPSDPERDSAGIDAEALAWLKGQRDSPYGNYYPSWVHRDRGMNDTLVLYDRLQENAGWRRYLALHRHGGIEVGASREVGKVDNRRAFRLRSIVGLTWNALALQLEAVDRWSIAGPFEVTVALRSTAGATLSFFAEGWPEPSLGEYTTCLDEHLLVRKEVDEAIDPESIAVDLGDRIELAFGTIKRRHLARKGDFEGRFDPR